MFIQQLDKNSREWLRMQAVAIIQLYLCEYLVNTVFNDERLARWIMAFNRREMEDKSQTL